MDRTSIDALLNVDGFDDHETSSSSSEESSDEELLEMLDNFHDGLQKKRSRVRYEYDDLSDSEFEMRFRLPREMVDDLVGKIKSKIELPQCRNNPISPKLQVLITLRFYAAGAFQSVIGDLFGVSQKSVSRIIIKVSHAIASLAPEELKFPSISQERAAMNLEFYKIAKIPSVIGVIDGTHIPIEKPGGPNAELYRNRKGFFSINTQVVVDASMKITDIVARWPGSNHDQNIFNFSQLKIRLEEKVFGENVILGDAGYRCKTYLITPHSNPITPKERAFQKAFIKTRLIVERTIGIWRWRFPAIATKMHCDHRTSVVIIVATSVLHNWLRHRPVPANSETLLSPFPELDPIVCTTGSSDISRRSQIIQNFF